MPSLVIEGEGEETERPASSSSNQSSSPAAVAKDSAADEPRTSITPPTTTKKDTKKKETTKKTKSKKEDANKNQPSIMSFFGKGGGAVKKASTGVEAKPTNAASAASKKAAETASTATAANKTTKKKKVAIKSSSPPKDSTQKQDTSSPSSLDKEALRDVVLGVPAPSPVGGDRPVNDYNGSLPLPLDVGSPVRLSAKRKQKQQQPEQPKPLSAKDCSVKLFNQSEGTAKQQTTEPSAELETKSTEDSNVESVKLSPSAKAEQEVVDMEIDGASPSKEMAVDKDVGDDVDDDDDADDKTIDMSPSSKSAPAASDIDEVVDEMEVTAESEPMPDTQPSSTPKAQPSVTAKSDTAATAPTVSPEHASLLEKHESLRSRYTKRALELIALAKEGLPEEKFEFPKVASIDAAEEVAEGAFPEEAIPLLVVLVQESHLPLSELAAHVHERLLPSFPTLTPEIVSDKIKLVASRDPYVSSLPGEPKANVFEDTNVDRMWRWELSVLELLPDESISKVKKARTARKKMKKHTSSISKLLSLLNDADKLFKDPKSKKTKRDAILTKISNEEEKILKCERDIEKERLAKEAKRAKEAAKKEKVESKKQKKQHKGLSEEDKEKKKAEAARKKEEAARLREEKKQQKQLEKEQKRLAKEEEKRKIQEEKDRKTAKQTACMMSFFKTPSKAKAATPHKPPTPCLPVKVSDEETAKFWALINSETDGSTAKPLFAELSPQAKASRRRRTRKVPVQVYVTVQSSNAGFGGQPYADLKTIEFPNKFKFLSFFEDCRPAYHGTWSKPMSRVVTGRSPQGKDSEFLDYDVDSEAEWEEGDDEFGEDVQDDTGEDEDDKADPDKAYDYQDGWLAEEDDVMYVDGEMDEDTEQLQRAKRKDDEVTERRIVVAMLPGGIPVMEGSEQTSNLASYFEGVTPGDNANMAEIHTEAIVLSGDVPAEVTMFEPSLCEEYYGGKIEEEGSKSTGPKSTNQEMTKDDIKTFADFVHHCKLSSKEQVIEQVRTAHPTITSSRAQAFRKLDAIAVKQRNPAGGSVWVVKEEVLKDLGMEKQLAMKIEVPVKETKPKATKKSKAAKATGAEPKPKKQKTSGKAEEAKSTDAMKDNPEKKASDSSKKRKRDEKPAVSKASINLFANFMQKKEK